MSAPAKPLLIYGVNGDGRGHAARALVLAPYLRPHYRIVFHSSQDALALLRQSFVNQDDIAFVEIPGTRWIYRHRRISPWRSALHFLVQALWVVIGEALLEWDSIRQFRGLRSGSIVGSPQGAGSTFLS